jgi:serine/threonine protein kinase
VIEGGGVLTPLTEDDPDRIGPYRLANRIGQGGMGTVYLGFSAQGTPTAIKVPASGLAHDPEFRARFRREVAAARRVQGAAVATVLDADTDGDRPWMATEYVEGKSLADAVASRGELDERLVTGLAVGLADALVAIHAAGVVHRDLKPANILLAWDGPRVIDFGIARAAGTTSHTRTGTLIGTLAWMAPEQLRGERAEAPADIFAWGACVAFAAAGRPPFRGDKPQTIGVEIMNGQPDLAGLPRALETVVRAALAKDPGHRPTAADILSRLVGHELHSPGESAAAAETALARWWSLPPTPPGGHAGERPAAAYPGEPARPTRPVRASGGAPGHQDHPRVRSRDHSPRDYSADHPGRPADHPRRPAGYGPARPGVPPAPPAGRPTPPPGRDRRVSPAAVVLTAALALLLGGGIATAAILARDTARTGSEGRTSGLTTPPGDTVTPTDGTTRGATAPPASTPPGRAARSATPPPATLSRADAANAVRSRGYTPDMATYDQNRILNVVVGTATGSTDGHNQRAFVFAEGRYRGTDTSDDSAGITVIPNTQREDFVTIRYQLFSPGDALCCPTAGVKDVEFYWKGGSFTPVDPDSIPPSDPNIRGSRR